MNRSEWLLKVLRDHLHRQPAGPSTGASLVYRNDTRNDQWIAESVFPGKRGGYFLEAGAGNGKDASSCYVLETALGWTGICVEPNRRFFAELVKNRPASICRNVCLSRRSGRVEFIEGGPGDADGYCGGIRHHFERRQRVHRDEPSRVTATELEAVTLQELLSSHAAPPIIDFAAIDVEGSEWDILQELDFQRYCFLAIAIECDEVTVAPIGDLLRSNGYTEVSNPFNRYQPWEHYWVHELLDGRNTVPAQKENPPRAAT